VEVLDESAVAGFMAGPYASIVRAVAVVTGDRAAAEDAVQEAVARAWERRAGIEDLPRWVVTTALNLARSRHRRIRREDPLDARPDRSVHHSAADTRVDLDQALRALPPRQREVVVLHYLLDLPVIEVAAIAGERGRDEARPLPRPAVARAVAARREQGLTMDDDALDTLLRSALHEHARAIAVLEPDRALAGVTTKRRHRRRRRVRRRAAVGVVLVLLATAVIVRVRDEPGGRVSTVATLPEPTALRPPIGPSVQDLAAGWWSQAVPPPRDLGWSEVVAWTGEELVVWGGQGDEGPQTDGFAYDPVTDRWRTLPPAPGRERIFAPSAWSGSQLFVLGGYLDGGGEEQRDGLAYSPGRDTWETVPDAPFAPGAAVWAGDRLIASDRSGAHVAGYDPTTAAWTSLPDPPGTSYDDRSIQAALTWDGGTISLWRTGEPTVATGPIGTIGHRLVDGRWEPVGAAQAIKPVDPVSTPAGIVAVPGSMCPTGYGCAMPVPRAGVLRLEGSTWVEHADDDVLGSEVAPAWTGRALVLGALAWDPSTDEWVARPLPDGSGVAAAVWTGSVVLVTDREGVLVVHPRGAG
jgi:RNA polymerase sigma-70 factor (ECF subfamily)